MNLRDLEYLVALAEERHFNRAAERCFVSQPTLSGQLKKLEEELGVVLVERSTRQVVMTEVGERVAARAREVLAGAKGIKELAQVYQDPFAGSLHLGLIPTVAPYLLPLIMPDLMASYPRLKFWLHEYQTAVLLEKLRRAELELLILALPVATDEFAELDLYDEPFLLALPNSAPLASKPLVTLADLNQREMLLLEEGHCLRGQALDVCFMAGATEKADFHASSLETLRYMVGEGMGMTLMPQLAARRAASDDGLRYIPFSKPSPSRRVGMLYRKGSPREGSFKQLAETIRRSVAKKVQ